MFWAPKPLYMILGFGIDLVTLIKALLNKWPGFTGT